MKVEPVRSLADLPPGKLYAVCRPLQSNVPDMGRHGCELTNCPKCGRPCWKTLNEPDTLPANVLPRCTECAMRIHLEQADEGGAS